ncbi:MAG: hypothetical protein K6F83_04540 [Clostridiales bacterium]|nr:hypothetical protein [Clostridiales bacterium]
MKTNKILSVILRVLIFITAITLIIIGMVTDKTYPYLPISLGLTAAGNFLNCRSYFKGYNHNKKA